MVLKNGVVKEIIRLRNEKELPIRKIGRKLHISLASVTKYINSEENKDFKKIGLVTSKQENLNIRNKEISPEERWYAFIEQFYKEEIMHLRRRLVIKRLREDIMNDKPKEKPEEKKITYIVDGAILKLTPMQLLEWKKYESEEKDRRERRGQLRRE